METKLWIVDKNVYKDEMYPQLEEAAHLLKQREVVAFPTETVYGLGADATSTEAVNKIFFAKGRPSDNPLIVHISTREQLNQIAESVPPLAERLIEHFWPGPLTLVLPKKDGVSEKVTAGLETVAVRMPDHPIALVLIEQANVPIAAPSANRSGKPSPTTASHVYDDLHGRISGIVDGGATGVGVESTVVDCTGEKIIILRPGGITKEQLEVIVGEVHIDPALKNDTIAPKSPGMKYTHYAPNAPLTLVDGSREFIQQLVNEQRKKGLKVGILTTEENQSFYDVDYLISCGKREDLSTVAASLYEGLRYFNTKDVDIIFSESFSNKGIGHAVMNRLMKASGHNIITEK